MKNGFLFLVLFSIAGFSQDNLETGFGYTFKRLLNADLSKDRIEDFSFAHDSRVTFKYADIYVYDKDTKVTRKYFYHNKGYILSDVSPDFDPRFLSEINVLLDYEPGTNLGDAIFTEIVNTLFKE